MSYWKKKYNPDKIQCCGKINPGKENERRCSNMFYRNVGNIKNDEICCHLHKEQKVTYSSEINQFRIPPKEESEFSFWENFKDIAILILNMIDSPSDYNSFARVSRSTAKAAQFLKNQKMTSFRKIAWISPLFYGKSKHTNLYSLPNGQIVDEENTFLVKRY